MSRAKFEEFVKQNLGDVPVMDNGRYISPKIQNYWQAWLAGRESMRDEAAEKANESQKADARKQARYVTAGQIANQILKIEP